MRTVALTQLGFRGAADTWLETRRPFISEITQRDYSIYINTLEKFFGAFHLGEISADQIRAYQRTRMTTVQAGIINKECSVLQQMLKRIGRWPDLAQDYQPLKVKTESRGRALTEPEYSKLFRVAATQPGWEDALLFAQISVNTGCGPKEVRMLRLKDIDIENRLLYIQIGGAKNPYRIREVPLNATAFAAVTRAIERSVIKGATSLEHFLFPFRVKRNQWDVTRSQTTFKTAWGEMCRASELRNFRMYDLRHHAATVMLSDPRVPPESAIEVLGHVSRQMLKRYSHLSREAKRLAVEALDRKPSKSSADLPNWLKQQG